MVVKRSLHKEDMVGDAIMVLKMKKKTWLSVIKTDEHLLFRDVMFLLNNIIK